jgi:hypothetical protein
MNDNKVTRALSCVQENHKDILRIIRVGNSTIVVLADGSVGVADRKKGDIDKPYRAAELAYLRAKEDQIMAEL